MPPSLKIRSRARRVAENLLRGQAKPVRRLLLATGSVTCRAVQSDMEMVVVALPRADLAEPRRVDHPRLVALGLAQYALDRRIDEDPRHGRILGGGPDDAVMLGRPALVQIDAVPRDDIDGADLLAVRDAQLARVGPAELCRHRLTTALLT